MKKLLLFYICFSGIIYAGTLKGRTIKSVNMPHNNFIRATGATSLAEISKAILLALQTNNAGQLTSYYPSDQEITTLRQLGSEDMKAVLENQSATDLQNSFDTDLQKIVQEGVSKTLNWSELEVADTKTGKGTSKNSVLFPVETVLQTKQNQPVSLVYEVIKLKNRYYLFRGIRLKS